MNKNDPPKYNVKIKNTGTSAWNGCFYLKNGGIDWVKIGSVTIGAGATKTLEGEVVINLSSMSNRQYELTLYYQTDCGGNGEPVPTSGSYDNPFTVTLTSSPTYPTPDYPDSPSPYDGEKNVPITLNELSWYCGGSDFHYELYFATNSSFDTRVDGGNGHEAYNLACNQEQGDSFTIPSGVLKPNTTYYWKVGIKDPNSDKNFPLWIDGNKSNYWTFTTASTSPGGDNELEMAVTYLNQRGIVDVSTPTAADTDGKLLRQQLAKITFMGVYGSKSNVPSTVPSDNYPTVYNLNVSDYYYRAAKALLYLDYGDGVTPFDRDRLTFDPEEKMLRAYVVKTLLEAFNIQPDMNSNSNPFSGDNDAATLAANNPRLFGYFRKAHSLGIITKDRPTDICTRGEAFLMLYRIMKLYPSFKPSNSNYFQPLNTTLKTIAMGPGLQIWATSSTTRRRASPSAV